MDENKKLWEKCVEFHGHVCAGLIYGYKASLYAAELLGLSFSEDEEIACVSENDACGVDAVQIMLGCSVGKGNLYFHLRGKHAFNFYDRKSGKSVRLVIKPRPEGMTKPELLEYYKKAEPAEIFAVKTVSVELPKPAVIFESYNCENCGEPTGSKWIRIVRGRKLCLDCCGTFDRFQV